MRNVMLSGAGCLCLIACNSIYDGGSSSGNASDSGWDSESAEILESETEGDTSTTGMGEDEPAPSESCANAFDFELDIQGGMPVHEQIIQACAEHTAINVSGDVDLHGALGDVDLSLLGCVCHIEGSLKIHDAALTSASGFTQLTSVTGDLVVYDLPQLTSLGEWPMLSSLGGLTIQDNPVLENSGAFTMLADVGGDFHLEALPLWAESGSWPTLSHIGGELVIKNAMQINSISFPKLQTVAMAVEVQGLMQLNALDLSALKHTSIVHINLNPNLQEIKLTNVGNVQNPDLSQLSLLILSDNATLPILDVPYLKHITGSVRINNNPALTTLGFAELQDIGDSLEMRANHQLKDLGAWPKLESVGGDLRIGRAQLTPSFEKCGANDGNDALQSFEISFPGLQWIGKRIHFACNKALADLSGFAALTSLGTALTPEMLKDDPVTFSLYQQPELGSVGKFALEEMQGKIGIACHPKLLMQEIAKVVSTLNQDENPENDVEIDVLPCQL